MDRQPTDLGHVVLLGDSIFDNASYVPGEPAVIEQLGASLPNGWQASLLAVDGHITRSVAGQLAHLPAGSTHAVISVGGNDALQNSHIIDGSVSAAVGFNNAADVQQAFRSEYRRMLDAVLSKVNRTAICTIYDTIHGLPRAAITALSIFNDVIFREGIRRGMPILDLRLICSEPGDYSALSPIEPSSAGGAKIAAAIAQVILQHDFDRRESVVYAGRG
jgi:hypothetical protein